MLPGVHTTSGRSSSDQQQQQLQASRMFRLPSIAPSVAGGRRPKSKQQPNPIQDAASRSSQVNRHLASRAGARKVSHRPSGTSVYRSGQKTSLAKVTDQEVRPSESKMVQETEERGEGHTKTMSPRCNRFRTLGLVALCLCVRRKTVVEREKQRQAEKLKEEQIRKEREEVARKEQERASRAGKKRDPSGRTDVLGHITPFDPAPFRRKKLNELMPMERVILRKLPKDRTDQEIVVIQELLARLPGMQKFEAKVLQQLARTLQYDELEEGRCVIKQGHIGTSFYFVVTGRLQVSLEFIDKQTGQKTTNVLTEMKEGSSFGDLALMHNIKRTATVVCKAPSELLRIDREDFQVVLQAYSKKDWDQRIGCLNWLPAFADWTPQEKQNCTQDTKVRMYKPNQIVHGNSKDITEHICFVIAGECRLVRHVIVAKKTYETGKVTYILPRDPAAVHDMCERHREKKELTEDKSRLIRLSTMVPESHFWIIGTLQRGHFFGIGEDMKSTYMIAKTKVEVLFVPRLQFVRTGRTRYLDTMRRDVEAAIPSNEQLLGVFARKRDWLIYKDGILGDVVPRHRYSRDNDTAVSDVPWSLRVATPTGFLRQFFAERRQYEMRHADATERKSAHH